MINAIGLIAIVPKKQAGKNKICSCGKMASASPEANVQKPIKI